MSEEGTNRPKGSGGRILPGTKITIVTDRLADPREPHTEILDPLSMRYTQGQCPACGIRGARGDSGQCRNCGAWWR